MPFILKKPKNKSPGIIVFTHKERAFVESNFYFIKKIINKVKKPYLFAMHWGYYHENLMPNPVIDFHLAGKGTVSFQKNSQAYHIPFSSRNFINEVFRPKSIAKEWDILMVASPIKVKRLSQFLETIRKIYNKGLLLKVLLICSSPQGAFKEVEKNLYRDYLALFTQEERESFTLLQLSGQGNLFQLSQSMLCHFYNASKVFTLFSEKEGESRVISEALLCGLPVVVKKDLLGGGRDYLNNKNSFFFNEYDDAPDVLIEAVGSYDQYRCDTQALRRQLSSEYVSEALAEELKKFFRKKGLPFEGECHFDCLDRHLPSHILTLPKRWTTNPTNDLRSHLVFYKYLCMILVKNPKLLDIFLISIYQFFWKIYSFILFYVKLYKHRFFKVFQIIKRIMHEKN